jgi:hypothetical protein
MSDGTSKVGPRDRRPGGGPGFSAARGAALVALAVIIGIVLLQAIDDGNNDQVGDAASSGSTTTSTTSAGGAGTTDTSASTPPPTVAPAEVTVRVLNGSGVAGAAGDLTNTLKAKGYQTLLAGDTAPRKGTVVDAKPAKTAECTTLAELITDAKVQAMPDPVPGGQDADCIVILGS